MSRLQCTLDRRTIVCTVCMQIARRHAHAWSYCTWGTSLTHAYTVTANVDMGPSSCNGSDGASACARVTCNRVRCKCLIMQAACIYVAVATSGKLSHVWCELVLNIGNRFTIEIAWHEELIVCIHGSFSVLRKHDSCEFIICTVCLLDPSRRPAIVVVLIL
jgi:hypothetical protein